MGCCDSFRGPEFIVDEFFRMESGHETWRKLNMGNQQPVESVVDRDELEVNEIFLTLQGEGPFSGRRAVFVRLAGCVLRCEWCDTEYLDRELMEIENVVRRCEELLPSKELVVVTGGEPLRQRVVVKLLDRLLAGGWAVVQLETSGSVLPARLPVSDRIVVVCSPKTGKLARGLVPNALKYVIRAGEVASDGLPVGVGRGDVNWNIPIYVSPCWEGDEVRRLKHQAEAVRSALEHGYTLSLQTHKVLGLR